MKQVPAIRPPIGQECGPPEGLPEVQYDVAQPYLRECRPDGAEALQIMAKSGSPLSQGLALTFR